MKPDWVLAVRVRRTLMALAAIVVFVMLLMCVRALGELSAIASTLTPP